MLTVVMKEYLMMAAPFVNFKIKCDTVNNNVKIVGKSAGYKCRLSNRFAFNSSMKERCIPQPGQSNPVNALYGQVIK